MRSFLKGNTKTLTARRMHPHSPHAFVFATSLLCHHALYMHLLSLQQDGERKRDASEEGEGMMEMGHALGLYSSDNSAEEDLRGWTASV